jgi:hypothetical protein
VELTLKSRPRYIEIFDKYASTTVYDGSPYLHADEKCLRRFKNLLDKLPLKSIKAGSLLRFKSVGLALASDLQKDPANAPIYVGDSLITLQDFALIGGGP